MTKISPKHDRFCREYVIDNNATQAYIRAGYSSSGAGQSAKHLLNNPKIAARVKILEDEIVKKLSEKHEVTKEKILLERARIAFFKADELYDENGSIKSPKDWGEDIGAIVSGLKVTELFEGYGKGRKKIGQTTEVKICNKDGSLAALEKMQGMYGKDNGQQRPYQHLSDEELWAEIDRLKKEKKAKLKMIPKNAPSRVQN
jgi:phage terminase small subunit